MPSRIELIHGDCMDYMRELPDNAFDLAIVDPPYGINAQGMNMGSNTNRGDGWRREEGTAVKVRKGRLNQGSGKLKNRALNTMNCDWDSAPPPAEYFTQLRRVSRNQIIWGGNYFDLQPTRCVICWDKCQPWENFSQWEMAWTSFDKPAAIFRHSNTGGAHAEKKIHPTQKPTRLYQWLISKYSAPGQRVLDTHLGSGSSAIAAQRAGVDFVGIEIAQDFYDAACQRFELETAQSDLFASGGGSV